MFPPLAAVAAPKSDSSAGRSAGRSAAWRRAVALGMAAALGAPVSPRAEAVIKPVPLTVSVADLLSVTVSGDIRTVMVANPEVADASVASPHKIVVLGKKPGFTQVLVNGAEGDELLAATVMVTPQDRGVVTVGRGIKETTLTCTPRCVANAAAKDTSGGASPPAQSASRSGAVAASPLPEAAPQPAAAPAAGAAGTAVLRTPSTP